MEDVIKPKSKSKDIFKVVEDGWMLRKALTRLERNQPEKFQRLSNFFTEQMIYKAKKGTNNVGFVNKFAKILDEKFNQDFRSILVKRASWLLRGAPKVEEKYGYDLSNKLLCLKNISSFDQLVNILELGDDKNLSIVASKISSMPRKKQLGEIVRKETYTSYKTIERLVILAAYKMLGEELPQLVAPRVRTKEKRQEKRKSNNLEKRQSNDYKPEPDQLTEPINGRIAYAGFKKVDHQIAFTNFEDAMNSLVSFFDLTQADITQIDPLKRLRLVLKIAEMLKFDQQMLQIMTNEEVFGDQGMEAFEKLFQFNGSKGGK